MKIALVHDWLPTMGGAERVLSDFVELYPDAPVYTLICNHSKMEEPLKSANIITSHLQKKKECTNHRKLFPFMPTAIESFDLTGYDMVLSSSSSVAKGVITHPDAIHICYCHSPMRYAWEFSYEYAGKMSGKGKLVQKLLGYFLTWIRVWDYASAARVDYFIANSENVAKRIRKHYRREAVVIPPPVRCKLFQISENDGDYFLVVSRFQEYKRVDIAIEACNRLGLKLKVVGDGPDYKRLKAMAGPTVELLGRVDDAHVKELYAGCRAFLFPGEEDFGITPLEAMASGRPVIAYGRGGALETVVEGVTGTFFHEQTSDSLVDALKRFETMKFDKHELRKHAEKFDDEVFKARIKAFVEEKYNERNGVNN